MIKTCTLCPRQCKALRTKEEGFGFCKMPGSPAVCHVGLHFGEEPVISGDRGSGTVFFTGCVLKCKYCQNFEISREYRGKTVDADGLCEIFRRLEEKGAHNINLVTPTHFADTVVKALEKYKSQIPVVYNSSGYESIKTLKALEGLVDIYLPDFKYSSSPLAQKYSFAPDYPAVCKEAISEMYHQTGKAVIENGIMKSGTLVRHLVLPGELQNSFGALDEIFDIFGKDAFVSLMSQFTPNGQCSEKNLNRKLTTYEYEKVISYMEKLGISQGFCQNRSSSGKEMLPIWNMT